jgi:branched-subunit amino acid transport protein
MALVTYMIRMIPLVLVNGKIESIFIKSFIYYVPYAVLSAMTIPAIFYSTSSVQSAAIGLAVAVTVAFFGRSLLTVALSACSSVFICEIIIFYAKQ